MKWDLQSEKLHHADALNGMEQSLVLSIKEINRAVHLPTGGREGCGWGRGVEMSGGEASQTFFFKLSLGQGVASAVH